MKILNVVIILKNVYLGRYSINIYLLSIIIFIYFFYHELAAT